ncbi:MAG: DUF1858 domain-containing protein [Patescibacteria group bacterium]
MNKNKKQIKVDRNTNIANIVFMYPQVEEVMLDYGLHCAGCFANAFDTIGGGAEIHGMDEEELEEMIDRINEAIQYEE